MPETFIYLQISLPTVDCPDMSENRYFFILLNEFGSYLHYLMTKLYLIMRLFLPWLGIKRSEFEAKNQADVFARSFREDHQQALLALEVSSQGEFQQVLGPIRFLLQRGERVEILYASESLEGDIATFCLDYTPEQIRFLRLPLIKRSHFRNNLSNVDYWITAPNFGFVRYDFYPHLLSHCFKYNRRVFLFWGSLKNKLSNTLSQLLWRQLSLSFDLIFAAGPQSLASFQSLNANNDVFLSEMRIMGIEERLQHRESKLTEKGLIGLKQFLEKSSQQKMILGSAYCADLEFLNHPAFLKKLYEGELILTMAPHSLSKENLENFKQHLLKVSGLKFAIVESDSSFELFHAEQLQEVHVILLTAKGILCELYPSFDLCYVGGGFERSIHSVLEPFWSGCHVICGPKTHRSTEFDFCQGIETTRVQALENRMQIAKTSASMDSFRNQFHNRAVEYLQKEAANLEFMYQKLKGSIHRNQ